MFQSYVTNVQCVGEHFKFYVADEMGKEWYDSRYNPREEMRLIRDRMVQNGDLVVECGCHHGFTTILLSKWVGPNGKVIAFDANPHNMAIATKNIQLNAITNVEIYPSAVGDMTGTKYITNESNSKIVSEGLPGDVEVSAIRLDDFLAGQIPKLVKIDVEGFEFQVLKGLQLTLEKKETSLAVEIHCDVMRDYGGTVKKLFDFIGLDDYTCWLGIGNEANDGIRPFGFKLAQLPSLSRVYLFAIPNNSVALRNTARR